MKKEMTLMADFDVFKKVPKKHAYDIWMPSLSAVRSRWVCTQKADGRANCRLMAQQIDHGEKKDTYGGTASSAGARLPLAITTERRRREERCTLLMGDVSTAFLYAQMEIKKPTFIVPPASTTQKGFL